VKWFCASGRARSWLPSLSRPGFRSRCQDPRANERLGWGALATSRKGACVKVTIWNDSSHPLAIRYSNFSLRLQTIGDTPDIPPLRVTGRAISSFNRDGPIRTPTTSRFRCRQNKWLKSRCRGHGVRRWDNHRFYTFKNRHHSPQAISFRAVLVDARTEKHSAGSRFPFCQAI